jgi:hypothetical protein
MARKPPTHAQVLICKHKYLNLFKHDMRPIENEMKSIKHDMKTIYQIACKVM